MKKTQILPLAAMISGLLVGCGGGSGGGGGGGGPVKTSIQLEFVKVDKVDASTAGSCQYYDRERTVTNNSGTENVTTEVLVAKPIEDALDSLLSIVYIDDNGEVVAESEETVSNGKVKIIVDDIPENGFISIKEQVGFDLYVTSFSQKLLKANASNMSTMLMTVVTPIPSLSCITGTNLSEVTQNNIRYINTGDDTSGDSAVFPYVFTSSIDRDTSNNPEINTSTGFQALSNDITLAAQYRADGSLFQYGFDDWSNSSIELSYTGNQKSIIRGSTVSYGDLDIGIAYKNTNKILVTQANTVNEYYHTDTLRTGEQWFARTSGTPTTNWNAELNIPLDDTWDLDVNEDDVFNVTTLADLDPEISNRSNNPANALIVDLSNSISIYTTEKGIQRVSLKPNLGSAATQLHTVYGFTNEQVIIPNIEAIDSSDLGSFDLQQNYWFSENNEDIDFRYVQNGFYNTVLTDAKYDAHGLILKESTLIELEAMSKSTKFLSLER
ncbi:hypothetical protein [Vibrio splendidus]|uniref:hypothetical protein n=1 Tax=Vibrio splendidus TaxID=29497 RepID=UPI001C002E28|nr:hypothetical protein [Vibrio splendidus]MBT9240517.1 hypothetical protein [Vibrio splendidus]MDP2615468.1 hypothetical protein [Vibrio splendidus]